jgi:hypothetical protein
MFFASLAIFITSRMLWAHVCYLTINTKKQELPQRNLSKSGSPHHYSCSTPPLDVEKL